MRAQFTQVTRLWNHFALQRHCASVDCPHLSLGLGTGTTTTTSCLARFWANPPLASKAFSMSRATAFSCRPCAVVAKTLTAKLSAYVVTEVSMRFWLTGPYASKKFLFGSTVSKFASQWSTRGWYCSRNKSDAILSPCNAPLPAASNTSPSAAWMWILAARCRCLSSCLSQGRVAWPTAASRWTCSGP